jgi:GWxTD domain-containing protein
MPPRAALVALPLVLLLAAAGCGPGARVAPRTAADVTNPSLSPEWSQWLVGPVSRFITDEEVAAFLALRDDAAAVAFVEAFWERRDPDPARPGNPGRELFEERAQIADRRFSEAGYLGRRTDRGVAFVLHGEPESIEFEISPQEGGPPIEVWNYAREHPVGLNGRQPAGAYRFFKPGDLTVIYLPSAADPRDRPLF